MKKHRTRRGRPSGSIAAKHELRREELLQRIADGISASGSVPAIRGLARLAGVSVATLLHYFGDRESLWSEVLGYYGKIGREHYLPRASEAGPRFEESILDLMLFLAGGFERTLTALHSAGLREALDSESSGVCYLENLLEPTLGAVEARLAAHQLAGQMRPGDLRVAALQLVSPVFLAALHQFRLGGTKVRPLDFGKMAATHAAEFCRGWGIAPSGVKNKSHVIKTTLRPRRDLQQ